MQLYDPSMNLLHAPTTTARIACSRQQVCHHLHERIIACAAVSNAEGSSNYAATGSSRTAEMEERDLQAEEVAADQV